MTRQEVINEKCKECIYDSEDSGTWKMQTEACELVDCALWDYRPKPRRKTPDMPLGAAVQLQYEGDQDRVIGESTHQCKRLRLTGF